MRRLKVIRALRCANYSLEAILHLLRQLSQNPDVDIRATLNNPKSSVDIISVCDRLIVSLTAAKKNAYEIREMLQNMKKNIYNPTLYHQPLCWWYSFSSKNEKVCKKVRNSYGRTGYDTISGRTYTS